MTRPDTTEAGVLAVAGALAPLADGPRVRVLSAFCQGVSYTLAAAVLRALTATQWHTDDCPGPMQFETEPVEAAS